MWQDVAMWKGALWTGRPWAGPPPAGSGDGLSPVHFYECAEEAPPCVFYSAIPETVMVLCYSPRLTVLVQIKFITTPSNDFLFVCVCVSLHRWSP